MSKYPYIQDQVKKKEVLCELCGDRDKGFQLEWRVDWFQGNCEFEKICESCFYTREVYEQEREEAYVKKMKPVWAAEAKKEKEFWQSMKTRLEEKYQVQYLTDYQWRINGVLDIYPTNRRYHDLKKNKRGDYKDMHAFLERTLNV